MLSVAVGIWAVRSWAEPSAKWALAGALAYLAAVVITAAANVPLNNSLATLNPRALWALWASFLTHWTVWNNLRGAVAAGLAFVIALIRR